MFLFIFVTSRESLIDFYTSSGKRKPDHVIIFRFEILELLFAWIIKSYWENSKKFVKSRVHFLLEWIVDTLLTTEV